MAYGWVRSGAAPISSAVNGFQCDNGGTVGSGHRLSVTDAEAAAFRELHSELVAVQTRIEYLRSGRFFREAVARHEVTA
jgi:hypothetical protein